MSRAKPVGQLRRDWLLLLIRHSLQGLAVGVSGGLYMSDDLKRLAEEKKITLTRVRQPYFNHSKRHDGATIKLKINYGYTIAKPADGVHLRGPLTCPCCKRQSLERADFVHSWSCVLRNDHKQDSTRRKHKHQVCG